MCRRRCSSHNSAVICSVFSAFKESNATSKYFFSSQAQCYRDKTNEALWELTIKTLVAVWSICEMSGKIGTFGKLQLTVFLIQFIDICLN